MAQLEGAIIGDSPSLRRVAGLAQRFAGSGLSVLLVGETGTGKELFAQAIHRWSGRGGALVDVNCGALPAEMVESLLFGHRRGAFTGAVQAVDGLVAAADGGTLFLDEVGSLSLEAQAVLLRVLETGEVRPLGGIAKRVVDLRIIAAAQENLSERVGRGAFRLDLYQRLAGIVLELPPLRERPEDLIPLARHFLGASGRSLSWSAEARLGVFPWSGNVRELRLAVERASWLSEGSEITPEVLEESIRLGAMVTAVGSGGCERERLVSLCRKAGWDIDQAARMGGLSRSTMYKRLAELRVSVRAARRAGASETVSDSLGPTRTASAPSRPQVAVS